MSSSDPALLAAYRAPDGSDVVITQRIPQPGGAWIVILGSGAPVEWPLPDGYVKINEAPASPPASE